jgi:Tol biopolymer transport system component
MTRHAWIVAVLTVGLVAPPQGHAGASDQGFALSRSLHPGALVEPGIGARVGRLSPDGTQIAYLAPRGSGPDGLFLMAVAGGTPRELVAGAFELGPPCWAPDGASIYFHSTEHGPEKIYRVEVATGTRQRVTHGSHHDLHPSLSADGSMLAFDSDREGGYDIWVQELPAGAPRRVTMARGPDFFPALHPDGTRVAFTSRRDGKWRIWAKPVSGGPAVPLSPGAGADAHPAASPNGHWVAFDTDVEGDAKIMLVDWDGGPPVLVDTRGRRATYPSFGGEQLAFTATSHGVTSIERASLGSSFGAPVVAAPRAPSATKLAGDFQIPPTPAEPSIPVPPARRRGPPLRVLSYQPAHPARPVPPETAAYLAFSHHLAVPEGGWSEAIRLTRGGAAVPAQVAYNQGLRRLEVTGPGGGFAGGEYRLEIPAGVLVGAKGVPFEGTSFTFQVEAGPGGARAAAEQGPFRIRAVSPKVGERGVQPDAKVAVRFSRAFDPRTVSAEAVHLVAEDGRRHPGVIRMAQGDRVLILSPYDAFTRGKKYKVRVDPEVSAVDGEKIGGKTHWLFQVAHGSGLKIVKVEPEGRELDSETTITLAFNRPLDPTSLDSGEMVLEGGSIPHKGSYYLGPEKRLLLFQPFSRLPPRTEFVLHLPAGLADKEGNPLELEQPLRFHTARTAPEGGVADLMAKHLGGGSVKRPSAYLEAASGPRSVPEWVPKVLKVLKRKGYLDPALAGGLDRRASLTRYKAALLVDSARNRQAAMTPYEKKIVERLASEFSPEMTRLGRGG